MAHRWVAVVPAAWLCVVLAAAVPADANAPGIGLGSAGAQGNLTFVVVEVWSGAPSPGLPAPPTAAECTGERLGRVRLHHPPGGGDLPGPLDTPVLTGPNGLSPVSVDIPDLARLHEAQCLRVGVGVLYREAAHVALPLGAGSAPPGEVMRLAPRTA